MFTLGLHEFIWFDILNRCPKCKGKVDRIGHLMRHGTQNYKCLNCGWGGIDEIHI